MHPLQKFNENWISEKINTTHSIQSTWHFPGDIQLSLFGSGEFLLLLCYEIQSTGTMTEGPVPVPLDRPCAESR